MAMKIVHRIYILFRVSGSALTQIVEVYKEIQSQQLNIVSKTSIFYCNTCFNDNIHYNYGIRDIEHICVGYRGTREI